MLILLLPSEGKRLTRSGKPLVLESLCLPELTGVRSRVLDAFISLCSGDAAVAACVLGLSPGQMLVMGHTSCGAMRATAEFFEDGAVPAGAPREGCPGTGPGIPARAASVLAGL